MRSLCAVAFYSSTRAKHNRPSQSNCQDMTIRCLAHMKTGGEGLIKKTSRQSCAGSSSCKSLQRFQYVACIHTEQQLQARWAVGFPFEALPCFCSLLFSRIPVSSVPAWLQDTAFYTQLSPFKECIVLCFAEQGAFHEVHICGTFLSITACNLPSLRLLFDYFCSVLKKISPVLCTAMLRPQDWYTSWQAAKNLTNIYGERKIKLRTLCSLLWCYEWTTLWMVTVSAGLG